MTARGPLTVLAALAMGDGEGVPVGEEPVEDATPEGAVGAVPTALEMLVAV